MNRGTHRASGGDLASAAAANRWLSAQPEVNLSLSADATPYLKASGFGALTRVMRVTPIGAARYVHGLPAGYFGQRITLINPSNTYVLVLKNASTSARAENRIKGGGDVLFFPGKACDLIYGGTIAGWQVVSLQSKRILFENLSLYVRTDGNDNNPGEANDASNAVLTLQKALDLRAAIDGGIYNTTIYVATGSYAGGASVIGPWMGAGSVGFSGTSATVSRTSGDCIKVVSGGRLNVDGLTLTTSSGSNLTTESTGVINVGASMTLGAASFALANAISNGTITFNSNYAISGGGTVGLYGEAGGIIDTRSRVAALSGTPAYAAGFAYVVNGGAIIAASFSYTGSATGTRFVFANGGIIDTAGGGSTFWPGNVNGSTGTTTGDGFKR